MAEHDELVARILREVASSLTQLPGLSERESRETANALAEKAYHKSIQRTDQPYREGFGIEFLERFRTTPHLQSTLTSKYQDGVTDADILWWWNLSAFEQEMLLQCDELNRITLYMYLRGKGMEQSSIAREVFKRHPKFGDNSQDSSPDRPLPHELKKRITSFIESHYGHPEALNAKIATSTSFNALIRKEIAAGTV